MVLPPRGYLLQVFSGFATPGTSAIFLFSFSSCWLSFLVVSLSLWFPFRSKLSGALLLPIIIRLVFVYHHPFLCIQQNSLPVKRMSSIFRMIIMVLLLFIQTLKSSLDALKTHAMKNPYISTILNLLNDLRNRGLNIKFCLVPGRMGINGNLKTDAQSRCIARQESVFVNC